MADEFEVRYAPLETNEQGLLSGYAIVWNSRSADLGGFHEIILPGAVTRSLQERANIDALVEHDPSKILAKTSDGTLRLTPDAHGLRVEIDPVDTSYAHDTKALVKRGYVKGMSFRFKPFAGGDSWDRSKAIPLRSLRSIDISEVSIVANPAYPATDINVRALPDDIEASLRTMRLRLRLAAQ